MEFLVALRISVHRDFSPALIPPEQYQCFLDYEAYMTKRDLWEKHRQEWLELNPPETHGKRMPFRNRSTSVDSRLEGAW